MRISLWRLLSSAVLIWSGEHKAWWRPNCCGYTCHRKEAGRYSFHDAVSATKHCGPEKKIVLEFVNET
jgi:hypothetical protein